jgi:hypothetical protein
MAEAVGAHFPPSSIPAGILLVRSQSAARYRIARGTKEIRDVLPGKGHTWWEEPSQPENDDEWQRQRATRPGKLICLGIDNRFCLISAAVGAGF